MPTILRQDGFEFRVWTNDHEPPHVHVFKAGGQVKIEIKTAEAVAVWNMRARDVRSAEMVVAENQELFFKAWRKIHG